MFSADTETSHAVDTNKTLIKYVHVYNMCTYNFN